MGGWRSAKKIDSYFWCIAVALHRSEPAIMQEIEKLDLYDRKANPRRQRTARQAGCLCGRCGNDPALCSFRGQCSAAKER
jgi:hypothetical protein